MKKILMSMLLVFAVTFAAHAAVPHTMSFQGKATDKLGAPLSGTVNMTFRIYDAETGGDALWTETHEALPVSNGIFSVMLGSVQPLDLPFDAQYWVSVAINEDGEMSPRTKLASVGYAVRAETAEAVCKTPVLLGYKKGFDIDVIDFNSVTIMPGVMDLAGSMVTQNKGSSSLSLEYAEQLNNEKYKDWIHGQNMPNQTVYIYAYNDGGQIKYKFSDEPPLYSNQNGDEILRPLIYQKYPKSNNGICYRNIGLLRVNGSGNIADVNDGSVESMKSIFSKFAGTGVSGDIVISEDTNFSSLTGDINKCRLEARNLTINENCVLTVNTKAAYIAVKGKLTVHGKISADGQGAKGGNGASVSGLGGSPGQRGDLFGNIGIRTGNYAGGLVPVNESSAVSVSDNMWTMEQLPIANAVTGGGGGGAMNGGELGGSGGGAGWFGGRGAIGGNNGGAQAAPPVPVSKKLRITGGLGDNIEHIKFFNPDILWYFGGGGGGANVSTSAGSNGGGIIYVESDFLEFDGVISAKGDDGVQSGGGGGGGLVLVRTNKILKNTGSVSVTGGVGGGGYGSNQNASAGADGFMDIVSGV